MRGGWIETNEIILDVIILEDTINGFHRCHQPRWFKALFLEGKKDKMHVLAAVVFVFDDVVTSLLLTQFSKVVAGE